MNVIRARFDRVQPIDPRDVILDHAIAEIERVLSERLGVVDRVAVVKIVQHACQDWAAHEPGEFW